MTELAKLQQKCADIRRRFAAYWTARDEAHLTLVERSLQEAHNHEYDDTGPGLALVLGAIGAALDELARLYDQRESAELSVAFVMCELK